MTPDTWYVNADSRRAVTLYTTGLALPYVTDTRGTEGVTVVAHWKLPVAATLTGGTTDTVSGLLLSCLPGFVTTGAGDGTSTGCGAKGTGDVPAQPVAMT
jgi:hypothetical protein